MAIPWLTLLKTVPWTEVIVHAPKVANGARKLWQSVAGGSAQPEIPPGPSRSDTAEDRLAAMEAEVRALRDSSAELHRQMLASSSLIRELAEQNTALIQRVETCRVRQLWLYGAVALLLFLVLAGPWLGWWP